jgi:hypothetical protein
MASGPTGYGRIFIVTPDDSNNLPGGVSDAIYIGTEGSLQVTDESGAIVAIPDLIAGWHPLRVLQIWNTNTAALNILAVRYL